MDDWEGVEGVNGWRRRGEEVDTLRGGGAKG